MSSSERPSYWLHWRSASDAEVHGTDIEPDRHNFLAFLAQAQFYHIEFLPIVWDAARGVIGTGGTSRIHQATQNLDTSFAFKAHRPNQSEEQIFRTLLTETSVLCHPALCGHPNVSQLQGICWEISARNGKPWPVLVFEKSHLGDLHHFARHEGRNMTIRQRLGLCMDIGRAVMAMHSDWLAHGDIKPHNVLVFRKASGRYSAKVTDFGYAVSYSSDSQRVNLSISEPWNAPENDGRRLWTHSDAARADLFCLALLMFWLLFETSLSGITPLPQDLGVPSIGSSGTAESMLRSMKGSIREYAQLWVSKMSLGEEEKRVLQEFFSSCFFEDPGQRNVGCLREFLEKLDPRQINARPTVSLVKGGIRIAKSDFKIEKSIYEFYATDYRVRSYIAQTLLDSRSQSTHIAIQAALCYYIGFGVPRNEEKAREILGDGLNIQVVKDIALSLDPRPLIAFGVRASTISNLERMALVNWSDFTTVYDEQGKLDEAEARLVQERNDLAVLLGVDHDLTGLVTDMLHGIYRYRSNYGAAHKDQVIEMLEISKRKLGADHPNTLFCMACLAPIYRSQGRWDMAEKIETEVLENSKRTLGADHITTLNYMANLAWTYQGQGRWDMAEKLQVVVVEKCKEKLGTDHQITSIHMASLAVTYQRQGRWDIAKRLQVEVMGANKQKLGTDHSETLNYVGNLTSTYQSQGRWDIAEKLKVGSDGDTLTSMDKLALTYRGQGWLEETK